MSEINVTQPPLSDGYETVSGMGHLLGYARVSTDQQADLQVDALERAGCYRPAPLENPVRPLQNGPEPPAAPRWCGFPGWRPEYGPPELP